MKRLEFKGSGAEYFKIWIVNILLTVLTLGIYYPWARVRNNKYLYINSTFDKDNFEYHATGKQLLIGYLTAAFFFIVYKVLEFFSPTVAISLLGVFFLIIPWLLWRSMKFNLYVTSFSNVRFNFNGKLKDSYIIFLLVPILSIIAIGFIFYLMTLFTDNTIFLLFFILLTSAFYIIVFSYFNVIKTRYFIEYTSYGQSDFSTNINTPDFIKVILKTVGIGIITALIFAVIIVIFSALIIDFSTIQAVIPTLQNDGAEEGIILILQLFYPVIILSYFCLIITSVITFAYYTTKLRAYIFENTNIENNVFFQSKMEFLPYATILVTNFLLILFTMGLAYPWAKIRVLKYSLENTAIYSKKGVNVFIDQNKKNKSGFADQISDTFDVDMGITL